jgi:hypothetical protein
MVSWKGLVWICVQELFFLLENNFLMNLLKLEIFLGQFRGVVILNYQFWDNIDFETKLKIVDY